MEVQEIWRFLSPQDQCYLLSYFPYNYQTTVRNIIAKDLDIEDPLFKMLAAPNTRVKTTYSFFIAETYVFPQTVILKWERDLGESVQDLWPALCLKAGLIFETNLRAFHIQFLHRAYSLNKIRAKFTTVDPTCTFCGSEIETYLHLFWECPHTAKFWDKVIKFCEEYVCVRGDIMSKDTCMLSNFRSALLVTIVSKMKHYIFVCKLNNTLPNVIQFFIRLRALRDRYFKRCKYLNKPDKYQKAWEALTYDPVLDSKCNQ